MEYNHKHIMLPAVSEQRWALWTAAVASIPMGIFFLVIGLIQRGRLGETVAICFFGLLFILLGLGCLISALARTLSILAFSTLSIFIFFLIFLSVLTISYSPGLSILSPSIPFRFSCTSLPKMQLCTNNSPTSCLTRNSRYKSL